MKAMSISKIVLIIIGFTVLTSYSNQWEVFTYKNDVRDIALIGTTLWAATTGGVVKWNLDDNSYKSFTTADGLISCYITQVAIDKKGRPWVATKNPADIFVYENHTWKQMDIGGTDNEISDKIISGLEVDQFGNVWVYPRTPGYWYFNKYKYNMILDSYVWRYDGRMWHKHEGVYGPLAIDLSKNLLAVDSLFYNNSTHRHQFRIVSFNGSEFVGKWFSTVNKYVNYITLTHLAEDSKGNLWISYYNDDRDIQTYGIVCNDTIYNTLDGLADDNVRSITADESGTVWCATDGGISKFTGKNWVTYDTIKGVASNLTYKILIGSNNTLYAATSKGISILKSNRFKTLKTMNEPSHNNHKDMIIDKRDAVILADRDHIAIYNDLQWKKNYFQNIHLGMRYDFYYDFPNHFYNKSFFKSKDGTLYAIGNEIKRNKILKGYILKQETGESTFFKAFSCTLRKYNWFMSPVVASSSNDSCFWLTGASGNLILLNKQTTEIFPPSRFGVGKHPEIACMLLDRDGRSVWVGYNAFTDNSAGIVHFDGNKVKKRINVTDGLASELMTAIARDSSENLWFASRRSEYRCGGVTVLRNSKLTTYVKDHNGKVFGGCNALFVDKTGMVWTHSDSGIARFDGNSWNLFNRAAVSPDLPYADYSHIIQDESGTVWFGTSGSGILAYKDNRWYQFTTRDGIPHNSIRSCALDSEDNLWILTNNGIAMRKSDETVLKEAQFNFIHPGNARSVQKLMFCNGSLLNNNRIIKQPGSPPYVSSKNKPEMIRYTLFDLRGRVVHRQTIHRGRSFVSSESYFKFNFRLGSGLRILSITSVPE